MNGSSLSITWSYILGNTRYTPCLRVCRRVTARSRLIGRQRDRRGRRIRRLVRHMSRLARLQRCHRGFRLETPQLRDCRTRVDSLVHAIEQDVAGRRALGMEVPHRHVSMRSRGRGIGVRSSSIQTQSVITSTHFRSALPRWNTSSSCTVERKAPAT